MKSLALLLLPLALAAAPARAQQAPEPAPLTVTAVNRTGAAEAERGAPRADEHVRAGDVLRYRLVFTNTAGRPVRGVNLANPLPGSFRFVGGSARATRPDARAEYSVDGGATFSPQPMEEVTVEGRRVRRPVAPERYTHVRWTVDGWVAPGATVTAEFDARFAGTAGTASPGAP